jgi:uncharacterized protein YbjT (DUF2867 family)
MRVLIVGATGLIGSAIAARLAAQGHQELVAVSRTPLTNPVATEWVGIDIAKATGAEHWTPILRGIEAVVKCVGILQDGPGSSTDAVQQQGVRRVVHLSAVDLETPTDFSRTKLRGDEALMARDLD